MKTTLPEPAFVDRPSGRMAGPSRPARVLHCIVALGGGGAERQLRNYVLHSTSPLLDQAVFAWRDGDFADELRERVPVFLEPSIRSRPWRAMSGLVGVLKRWRPDLIQTWSPQFDALAPILAWGRGPRVIGSERNSRHVYENPSIYGRKWYTRLRPHALRRGVVAVCANSPGGARYVREGLSVTAPTFTVLNGLDLAEIRERATATRASLGLPDPTSDPVIVAVSRLAPVKRIDLILDALALLRGRGLAPHLLVCGGGGEGDALSLRADSLGLCDRVSFLGPRRDAVSIIKAADVFCTASEGEGLPNAALEAMACGVPVVASDIEPHRDLLGGSGAGRLFTSGSAESLALALETVLKSPSDRREMARAGLAASAEYGISAMCDRLDAIYLEIAGLASKADGP